MSRPVRSLLCGFFLSSLRFCIYCRVSRAQARVSGLSGPGEAGGSASSIGLTHQASGDQGLPSRIGHAALCLCLSCRQDSSCWHLVLRGSRRTTSGSSPPLTAAASPRPHVPSLMDPGGHLQQAHKEICLLIFSFFWLCRTTP